MKRVDDSGLKYNFKNESATMKVRQRQEKKKTPTENLEVKCFISICFQCLADVRGKKEANTSHFGSTNCLHYHNNQMQPY